MKKKLMLGLLAFALLLTGCGKQEDGTIRITNVSYDPTREFYEAYNQMFEEHYQDTYGETVEVIQSHGGSGAQARSVVEGCNADVVTLALEHDITLIQNTGLIDAGWKEEFSDDSSPYISTIVFLVRKGNPKQIQDWDDLIREDVEVITPWQHLVMRRSYIRKKRSSRISCGSYTAGFRSWIPEPEVQQRHSWRTKKAMCL